MELRINMVRISSAMIHSVGYHAEAKILQIVFRNNSMFQYFNVPKNVYMDMIAANSKGNYFSVCVKDAFYHQYPYFSSARRLL